MYHWTKGVTHANPVSLLVVNAIAAKEFESTRSVSSLFDLEFRCKKCLVVATVQVFVYSTFFVFVGMLFNSFKKCSVSFAYVAVFTYRTSKLVYYV